MKFLQMLITSLFAFLFTRAVGSVVAPADGVSKADPDEPRRPMVRCSSCGVYVLRERALPAAGGAYVCSASCAGRRSQ
jgi:hypothetical protein